MDTSLVNLQTDLESLAEYVNFFYPLDYDFPCSNAYHQGMHHPFCEKNRPIRIKEVAAQILHYGLLKRSSRYDDADEDMAEFADEDIFVEREADIDFDARRRVVARCREGLKEAKKKLALIASVDIHAINKLATHGTAEENEQLRKSKTERLIRVLFSVYFSRLTRRLFRANEYCHHVLFMMRCMIYRTELVFNFINQVANEDLYLALLEEFRSSYLARSAWFGYIPPSNI